MIDKKIFYYFDLFFPLFLRFHLLYTRLPLFRQSLAQAPLQSLFPSFSCNFSPLSTLELQLMNLITELTSKFDDSGIIFNIYTRLTFLVNITKEEGLLARDSRICTAQFTVLTNDCCMAKKKARFFPLISSYSLHERRQTRIQEFYFPFPYMCWSIRCQLWISCIDTVTFTLWKLCRLMNDSE